MFIRTSAVRTAFKEIASQRKHKLTRVSREYLEHLDAEVLRKLRSDIMSAPSLGVTLYPKIREKKDEELR